MFTQPMRVGKVAVIGKTIVDQLFPNEDPIGQTVRVRDIPFRLSACSRPLGFNLFGQDQDDTMIIPYTSHMKRVSRRTFVNSHLAMHQRRCHHQGAAEVTEVLMQTAQRQGTGLHRAHAVGSRADGHRYFKIMSVLLAAIASVSLVVGGIGIMNIMLVSVTERTREIGIRMAAGARSHDILVQFLVEAVTLSAIGGLVGIGLGMVASHIVASSTGWPTLTPVSWIGIASLSSALVALSPVLSGVESIEARPHRGIALRVMPVMGLPAKLLVVDDNPVVFAGRFRIAAGGGTGGD